MGGTLRKQQKNGGSWGGSSLAHCSEASELMGRNAEPRKNWGREGGRKKKRIVVHSPDSFERKEKEEMK